MISKYRGNRQAISALVRETEVHRDLYLDQELFELEMEHLFANTWIYVGHESQVPKVGDYYATTIGAQPVGCTVTIFGRFEPIHPIASI